MGILAWIVFGLVAGIVAKWIMPGRDPGGFILTVIIGIAGALIGGYLSTLMGMGDISGFDIRSFIIAVLGALILLFIYHRVYKVSKVIYWSHLHGLQFCYQLCFYFIGEVSRQVCAGCCGAFLPLVFKSAPGQASNHCVYMR